MQYKSSVTCCICNKKVAEVGVRQSPTPKNPEAIETAQFIWNLEESNPSRCPLAGFPSIRQYSTCDLFCGKRDSCCGGLPRHGRNLLQLQPGDKHGCWRYPAPSK